MIGILALSCALVVGSHSPDDDKAPVEKGSIQFKAIDDQARIPDATAWSRERSNIGSSPLTICRGLTFICRA